MYNTLDTLKKLNINPYALVVAFDRREKTLDSELIASEEIAKNTNLKVISIANVNDLLNVVTNEEERANIQSHLDKYSTS